MHPRVLDSIDSYTLLLGLAVVAGTVVALFSARHAGLPTRRFAVLLAVLGVAALAGAKLYSILERGKMGSIAWEIGNGYRYPGGIVACLVTASFLPRVLGKQIGFLALAELLAPSIAFGTAMSRLGCLLEGCCSGTVCRLPWAVSFPAGSPVWHAQVAVGLIPDTAALSLSVQPLQVYFFVVSFSIGVLLLRLRARKVFAGQVVLVLLTLDNTAKFSLESLRDPYEHHLQLASLLLALGSASLLLLFSAAKTHRRFGAAPTEPPRRRRYPPLPYYRPHPRRHQGSLPPTGGAGSPSGGATPRR